jgi:hypothetical protein
MKALAILIAILLLFPLSFAEEFPFGARRYVEKKEISPTSTTVTLIKIPPQTLPNTDVIPNFTVYHSQPKTTQAIVSYNIPIEYILIGIAVAAIIGLAIILLLRWY